MKRILFHLIFWLVILFWRANGDFYWGVPLKMFVLHNLIRLPVIIILTYWVIYYLLPKFIVKEKQYLKFAIWFSIGFWLAFFIDEKIINSDIMSAIFHSEYNVNNKSFKQYHPYRNSFALLSIIGLASLTRFFKLFLQQERNKYELEQEHLATKLAFLKSQVNPHFLFNALNNIYSMAVQKEQKEIASSLENLSGIMHYLTYESSSHKVPLEKEIELLKNYIDIQHLRIADVDDTTVSFNVEGNIMDKKIAPVILLPIVENAFKHGIKLDQKCIVSIVLVVSTNALIFKTTNTFFKQDSKQKEEKGIGLDNVLKRLNMIYPDQYQFESSQNDNTFFTKLRIQF